MAATTLAAGAAAAASAAAAATPAAATTSCHFAGFKSAFATLQAYSFGHTVNVWFPAKEEAKDECACTVMKTIKAVANFFAALVLAPFAAIHHAYVALKEKIQAKPATATSVAAAAKPADGKPATTRTGWLPGS